MCLIAKVIRISHANFHCNRIPSVQDIQDYVSLIFTERCVCIVRTMTLWTYARCLPVCPSVWTDAGIESKRLYIVPQSFFHHRVAPPFQFSYTKRDGNIPTGTSLTGVSNARGGGGYENIATCDQYLVSRFISQMMQDRAIVTMKANRKPHPSFPMVPV